MLALTDQLSKKPSKTTTKNKPALLFIHGFRGAPLGLQKITEQFPDYEVYVPSIPPFGESSPLDKYSIKTYTQFIIDYIKGKKLKKPVLVGHSMGSIIAAAVASRCPEEINEKVILMSPISNKPKLIFSALQPLVAFMPNKTLGWISTKYLNASKDKDIYKESLHKTWECGKHQASRADALKSARFSTAHSVDDTLFDKDTLIISGDSDYLVKKQKTIELAEKLNAKLVFIPNSGHLHIYEEPEKTAQIIRDFLNR